ncbi:CTP-dependent riboflavin kinase [Candidatus Bathyarchaeota archaeon]|nr:CTP-dependent riboflavin kinase [Candidatus Bathyarchaeota archaeon]
MRTRSLRAPYVKGMVFSGKGEGAKFVKLSWVKEQLEEKLGFTPYPGTLNIRLSETDCVKYRGILRNAKPLEILPAEGFNLGSCFKACLTLDLECAVVIPEVANYPKNIMEIIASVNLRKTLHLRDGDTIEVRMIL